MANPRQPRDLIFSLSFGAATAALAIAFMLTVVATQPARAQTYTVLHNFTGGGDGFYPKAGVTLDQAGSLYGTADGFESYGYGTVYKLTHQGSNWSLNPLYEFTGGSDGANPEARVIFGPNGTLYGTTYAGGTYNGGTVFNLRPYPAVCKTALCPWAETVLYPFSRGADGYYPSPADLIFDQAGNIYGTTIAPSGNGVVYELTPSGGGWTESVLHSFSGYPDGAGPFGGVILDNAGNLYGTTESGGTGSGQGTVFELTYSMGSGWSESILYSFQGGSDGGVPLVGLIFDPLGNLYGATSDGGSGGGGTVFKLTPSGGSWTFSLVYSFTGNLCHGRSGQSLWHHGLRRGLQPGLGFRADAIQWRLDLQIASRFLRRRLPLQRRALSAWQRSIRHQRSSLRHRRTRWNR